MFTLKCLNFLRTPLKINFSQFRELRRISKEYEIINHPGLKSISQKMSENDFLEHLPETIDAKETSPEEYKPKSSVFEEFAPTFNLAAYLNKSETLQQLLKLGVDFHRIERRKGLGNFVLKLDFEKDLRNHLIFLSDIGIPADKFGEIITKNPLIFKIDLDDLQTRINYLISKNFNKPQIQRICTNNPFWLMFPTRRIDKRLGYFQNEFKLTGEDIRFLATKQPRLITYRMESIQKNTFCIREEMGFDKDEIRYLLLNKPRLWMMKSDDLVERFDYIHNTMKINHDQILEFSEILTSREYRLRHRHEFLKSLGRAQYDPKKDLYVSLKTLVEGDDQEFAENIAKTDLKTYDMFLRTL